MTKTNFNQTHIHRAQVQHYYLKIPGVALRGLSISRTPPSLRRTAEAGPDHRTKSHVSVSLKRGGNMQFQVSVIFTSCGNVEIQGYVIPSCFRNRLRES